MTGFPIVGIGASAGGLSALYAFFDAIEPQPGLAFVVVTHQHEGQPPLLRELLARRTSLPVMTVDAPTSVEVDTIYLPVPGSRLVLSDGVLRGPDRAESGAIDQLFHSLADHGAEGAVGIVLSGMGSDGASGLERIERAGGLALVQDPTTAEHDSMPRAAIATGAIDLVLPASEMPTHLVAYARSFPTDDHTHITRVLGELRSQTGHDFSNYKRTSVLRRLARRLVATKCEGLDAYAELLRHDPDEVDALLSEMLIGVTSFFRDAEAFDALQEALCSGRDDSAVRVWVPGCSTGEEAYSIAIALCEVRQQLGAQFPIQIFATDIDVEAIQRARIGWYPSDIAADVSEPRLERFFTPRDDGFLIRKEIRDLVIFAPQNLLSDPPFSKLDLICCRNVLIYFDSILQQRLMPIFHYALRSRGLLFLGTSESVGGFTDVFHPTSQKWKIYRRGEGSPVLVARVPVLADPVRRPRRADARAGLIERLLLKHLVPPTLVVRASGDIVHIHGRTGHLLEPAPGPQSKFNLFDMAREGLHPYLSTALREAADSGDARRSGVRVRVNGRHVLVDVHVQRTESPSGELYLIAFDELRIDDARDHGDEVGRVVELEQEVRRAAHTHLRTVEELAFANEGFKAANEELQSTNEELQSSNEELETSREEMQSLNEELKLVNAELHAKVDELSRASDDMKNLLDATNIPTIVLDSNLDIKWFTEGAKRLIRVLPSDIGRPVGDLVSSLDYDRFVADAEEVLRTLVPRILEIRANDGEWYLLRILPYRTTEHLIDGVVITFVDITATKALQDTLRHLDSLSGFNIQLFGQDRDLRYTWISGDLFGRTPSEIIGRTDADLIGSQSAALDALKHEAIARATPLRRSITLDHVHDVYVVPIESASMVVGISGLIVAGAS